MSPHSAYRADVGDGLTVYVTQDRDQDGRGRTTVTTEQGGSTQSQGAGAGEWTQAPQLIRAPGGAVLHLRAGDGDHYLRVGAGGVQTLDRVPDLGDAESVQLQETDPDSVPRMKPMEPMKPMKPMEPMKPLEPLESMRPTRNEKPLA